MGMDHNVVGRVIDIVDIVVGVVMGRNFVMC